jgi:2-keto-4-pentenoate hydratase/2-oxohepta-3-ene-1,7-dioic acid hydratase in catechol pathway
MRLFSYRTEQGPAIGVLRSEDSFVPLAIAAPELPNTMAALLAIDTALDRIAEANDGRHAEQSLREVAFDLLVPDFHAFWGLALNFKKHIEETNLDTSRVHPQIFLRMRASLVAAGANLICPPPELGRMYAYEGELAVIIGKGGRHIPLDRALDHVAGYTICNEGSLREFQAHNRQFGLGKNMQSSGSFGPWLTTRDEFGALDHQSLITRLNGVIRQNSPLSDMLFTVEQAIAYLSSGYCLRPGDVIAMGTPGAVSSEANGGPAQPVDMKPGDTVEVTIEGLGMLHNRVVADGPACYRIGAS